MNKITKEMLDFHPITHKGLQDVYEELAKTLSDQVDELTDEEKREALNQAIIKQGEELCEGFLIRSHSGKISHLPLTAHIKGIMAFWDIEPLTYIHGGLYYEVSNRDQERYIIKQGEEAIPLLMGIT